MKRIIFTLLWVTTLLSPCAQAGVFDLGGSFALNRSNYNDGSYTWSRRYGASFGYYFTQESEIEFSFQDSVTRTVVTGVQDVSFHDQVYSLDLNYHFLPEDAALRPFIKVGVGQLNRDATGTYVGYGSPPGRTDQITTILGGGFKARISTRVGLKAEVSSYLTGGSIATWKDNMALMIGGSFFF